MHSTPSRPSDGSDRHRRTIARILGLRDHHDVQALLEALRHELRIVQVDHRLDGVDRALMNLLQSMDDSNGRPGV
ncbi:MAG: hypothetical protein KY455_10125 [Euryarchaeota archaeon]|nr:hypothetical protein [Euryarchaeota archaeon]